MTDASTLPPPPPPPPRRKIEVRGVSKWFGDVVAVSEVTFGIDAGITALLGPNGAGKSTMLRMLCGLTKPSLGTIEVLGSNPRTDRDLARQIGIVPQQEGVFEHLTLREFVRLGATLQELDDPDDAAVEAIRMVDLDPDDTRPVSTYSKGMRQRTKVAHALVHDPEVVYLDEPLTGLDPKQRLRMVELFRRLGDEGKCVVVSSHVLEEVERFGSRVLVIAQGRLAATGDFRDIRDKMDERPHRIRVTCTEPRTVAAQLVQSRAAVGVRLDTEERIIVDTDDVTRFRTTIAVVAQQAGARLHEVRPMDEDLESVFRYLVEGK